MQFVLYSRYKCCLEALEPESLCVLSRMVVAHVLEMSQKHLELVPIL